MATIQDLDIAGLKGLLSDRTAKPGGHFVLVDFWAPWCAPCRSLHAVIAKMALALGDTVDIVRLNVEKHADAVKAYDVQGIPQLILFRDGQEIARRAGSMSQRQLSEWLGEQGVATDAASLLAEEPRADVDDARTLGAFYGDADLRSMLVDRAVRAAREGRLRASRFPYFTEEAATISTTLAGGKMPDLFERLTGMPIGIVGLLEFCSIDTAEHVEQVVGAILPGHVLDRLPLRFVYDWLTDPVVPWREILVDGNADVLRLTWTALARKALDGETVPAEWKALRDEASALNSTVPEREVVDQFACFISGCSPIEVGSRQWVHTMLMFGTHLALIEAGHSIGMTADDFAWGTIRHRWFDTHRQREGDLSPERLAALKKIWEEEQHAGEVRHAHVEQERAAIFPLILARHRNNLARLLVSTAP